MMQPNSNINFFREAVYKEKKKKKEEGKPTTIAKNEPR